MSNPFNFLNSLKGRTSEQLRKANVSEKNKPTTSINSDDPLANIVFASDVVELKRKEKDKESLKVNSPSKSNKTDAPIVRKKDSLTNVVIASDIVFTSDIVELKRKEKDKESLKVNSPSKSNKIDAPIVRKKDSLPNVVIASDIVEIQKKEKDAEPLNSNKSSDVNIASACTNDVLSNIDHAKLEEKKKEVELLNSNVESVSDLEEFKEIDVESLKSSISSETSDEIDNTASSRTNESLSNIASVSALGEFKEKDVESLKSKKISEEIIKIDNKYHENSQLQRNSIGRPLEGSLEDLERKDEAKYASTPYSLERLKSKRLAQTLDIPLPTDSYKSLTSTLYPVEPKVNPTASGHNKYESDAVFNMVQKPPQPVSYIEKESPLSKQVTNLKNVTESFKDVHKIMAEKLEDLNRIRKIEHSKPEDDKSSMLQTTDDIVEDVEKMIKYFEHKKKDDPSKLNKSKADDNTLDEDVSSKVISGQDLPEFLKWENYISNSIQSLDSVIESLKLLSESKIDKDNSNLEHEKDDQNQTTDGKMIKIVRGPDIEFKLIPKSPENSLLSDSASVNIGGINTQTTGKNMKTMLHGETTIEHKEGIEVLNIESFELIHKKDIASFGKIKENEPKQSLGQNEMHIGGSPLEAIDLRKYLIFRNEPSSSQRDKHGREVVPVLDDSDDEVSLDLSLEYLLKPTVKPTSPKSQNTSGQNNNEYVIGSLPAFYYQVMPEKDAPSTSVNEKTQSTQNSNKHAENSVIKNAGASNRVVPIQAPAQNTFVSNSSMTSEASKNIASKSDNIAMENSKSILPKSNLLKAEPSKKETKQFSIKADASSGIKETSAQTFISASDAFTPLSEKVDFTQLPTQKTETLVPSSPAAGVRSNNSGAVQSSPSNNDILKGDLSKAPLHASETKYKQVSMKPNENSDIKNSPQTVPSTHIKSFPTLSEKVDFTQLPTQKIRELLEMSLASNVGPTKDKSNANLPKGTPKYKQASVPPNTVLDDAVKTVSSIINPFVTVKKQVEVTKPQGDFSKPQGKTKGTLHFGSASGSTMDDSLVNPDSSSKLIKPTKEVKKSEEKMLLPISAKKDPTFKSVNEAEENDPNAEESAPDFDEADDAEDTPAAPQNNSDEQESKPAPTQQPEEKESKPAPTQQPEETKPSEKDSKKAPVSEKKTNADSQETNGKKICCYEIQRHDSQKSVERMAQLMVASYNWVGQERFKCDSTPSFSSDEEVAPPPKKICSLTNTKSPKKPTEKCISFSGFKESNLTDDN